MITKKTQTKIKYDFNTFLKQTMFFKRCFLKRFLKTIDIINRLDQCDHWTLVHVS